MTRYWLEGIAPTLCGSLLMVATLRSGAARIKEEPFLFAMLGTLSSFLLVVGIGALCRANGRKRVFKRWTWILISLLYFLASLVTLVTLGFVPSLFPLAASVLTGMWTIGLLQFLGMLATLGTDGEI